ncbi:MAG: DUF2299 family protein [Nitrospirota bacterium]
MEITTVEQAKDAIAKWLKENQHSVTEIKDENANFHFEIDYPLGSQKRQRIIQPKEYPGLMVLLNGVSLAPDHVQKLKEMEDDKRDEFYSELRNDLIFLENSYDMNLDEQGVAKQVQFSYEFYFDALTKTQLFKGLLLNHRTLLYIVTKFNDKFGIPAMPKEHEVVGAA